jgi:hypothetical protein
MMAVHFKNGKALVVLESNAAPPHGGGGIDNIKDAHNGTNKLAAIAIWIHFFCISRGRPKMAPN